MSNGTLDDIDNRVIFGLENMLRQFVTGLTFLECFQYWQLWKNGEIPYTLASGFGSGDRANIAKAVKYLERVSCLR